MFFKIWGGGSCEAILAQFGRGLAMRSCGRKMRKNALAFTCVGRTNPYELGMKMGLITLIFDLRAGTHHSHSLFPFFRRVAYRSIARSRKITDKTGAPPYIYSCNSYLYLRLPELRTSCSLRQRRKFESQQSLAMQFL